MALCSAYQEKTPTSSTTFHTERIIPTGCTFTPMFRYNLLLPANNSHGGPWMMLDKCLIVKALHSSLERIPTEARREGNLRRNSEMAASGMLQDRDCSLGTQIHRNNAEVAHRLYDKAFKSRLIMDHTAHHHSNRDLLQIRKDYKEVTPILILCRIIQRQSAQDIWEQDRCSLRNLHRYVTIQMHPHMAIIAPCLLINRRSPLPDRSSIVYGRL